jgi:hypothetical protein
MKKKSIPKAATKLFRVNLQQGFIVDAETETIYGAYHHVHEAVITVAPWSHLDFKVPSELRHYKIYDKRIGGLAITGWTPRGHMSIATLTKRFTEKEKIFEKL